MNNRTLLLLLLVLPLAPLSAIPQQSPEDVAGLTITETEKHHTVSRPADIPDEMTLKTIFGTVVVTEPVLLELIHHPAVERLKKVDQHGPSTYYLNYPTFSRYEHSIGVFTLLRRFGASLTEQVAGLLHDASHTAFSHLADRLYKTGNEVAYQDHIHEWYLEKSGLTAVLKKYNIAVTDIMPDQIKKIKGPFPSLMGADRIEYNLRTGLVFGRLTQEEVTAVISDLRLTEDTWYFTTQKSARKIADQALYFTEHFWGSDWNTMHHDWLVSALRVLVAREEITSHDIHFGNDDKIITLLNESKDLHIKAMLHRCRHPFQYFRRATSAQSHDLVDHPKCRGINPLIEQEDGEKVLLTTLDEEFKASYDKTKAYCSYGLKLETTPDGSANTLPSALDTLVTKLPAPVVPDESIGF